MEVEDRDLKEALLALGDFPFSVKEPGACE